MDATAIPIPEGFVRFHERRAVLLVRDECADKVRAALGPLDRALENIRLRRFTARGRAGIVSLSLAPGEPPMMVRRYVHGGLFGPILRDLYLGPDRALDELEAAEAARLGGVRTPLPLGVLCRHARGPLWRLAWLSQEVADSEDLIHYCCRLTDYPAETTALEKRGVIREAAAQVRRMHDLGIYHADLHLKNLLLQRQAAETPRVYVLDFDKARLGRPLDAGRRLANLKRLARSVRKIRVADALLTTWDRLRFLREYLRGAPDARALLRAWAPKLASSGRAHEVWWTATRAQRALRGDAAARRNRLGAAMRSGPRQGGSGAHR